MRAALTKKRLWCFATTTSSLFLLKDDDEAVERYASLAAGERAISEAEEVYFTRRGHLPTFGLLPEVECFADGLRSIAREEDEAAVRHAEAMNGDDSCFPFLQTFNPHRRHGLAYGLASCDRLVGAAAALLGVTEVRLYQTSIFWKRAGDVATNWHSDLGTSVLDANDFVTAWIPLQRVPEDTTGLLYAEGSHRDVAVHFWSGNDIADDRYVLADHGALALGDVSWHHGWTLHSAAENQALQDRFAFTVSYFADDARLVPPEARVNHEDFPSYEDWIDDFTPGDIIHDHPALPTLAVRRIDHTS